jgi:hypothetical protein
MAISYVEQAILRVKDQSSKPIGKINAELKKLFATSRRPLRVNVTGLDKAARDMKGLKLLGQEMAKLGRRKPISIPVSAPGEEKVLRDTRALNKELERLKLLSRQSVRVTGRLPVPRPAGGAQDGTLGEGVRSALRPFQIGRDIARGFTFAISGSLAHLGAGVARTAAVAPLTMEEAQSKVRTAGRSEAELEVLQAIAEVQSQRVGSVSAAEILGNAVETTGTFGDLTLPENAAKAEASMMRLADNAAILVTALGMSADKAAEEARKIEKSIQIQGEAGDPLDGARIAEAALKATIASGGDLLPAETVRMLQQLGGTLVAGLSPDALLQIALLRDEGGRMSTAEVRMAYQDMTRGNLNASDLAAQIAVGLRDAAGKSLYGGQFSADPMAFVNEQIIPRLNSLGVDLSDTEAVSSALDDELGFTTTGVRFFASAVANAAERMAEFERAQKVDTTYAKDNPTARAQAQAVKAQFENVAAEVGTLALPAIKTGLDILGDSLGNVAQGEGGVVDYATIAAAATPLAVGAALAGIADPLTRPMSLASLSLTGSATALDVSAGALTAAAIKLGATPVAGGAAAAAAGGAAAKGSSLVSRLGGLGRALGAVGAGLLVYEAATMETGDHAADPTTNPWRRWNRENGKKDDHLPTVTGDFIPQMWDDFFGPAEVKVASLVDQLAMVRNPARDYSVVPSGSSRRGRGIYVRSQREDYDFGDGGLTGYLSGQDADEELRRTFSEGTSGLAEAGESAAINLQEAGKAFGPAAAAALMSIAGPMGQAMGQAAAAQLRGISIGTNGGLSGAAPPMPRLDTGASGPL